MAVNPSDSVIPVNAISNITEIFSSGLNSTYTVQVRLTVDLMGRTGLGELAEIITELGGGTVCIRRPEKYTS